jgi:hypothetical protein
MAIRLLPFRQYAEEDVVNLYASTEACDSVLAADAGDGDAGVFVSVSAGDFGADPVGYVDNGYLGKTDYPFIGRNQYPTVPLKVAAAQAGDPVLGITLLQTAQADENGEKLLYYPQKKLEVQAVLTGEAVPVLGKGIVTLDKDTAFDGSLPAPGNYIKIGSTNGKVADAGTNLPTGSNAENETIVGQVLATGQRVNRGVSADQFAGASVNTGAAGSNGTYAVVRINC